MREFKVGDKVRVRKGLKGSCSYGGVYFATEMEEYTGKIFEIISIHHGDEQRVYRLKNCGIWNFAEEMLEPVEITLKDLQFADVLITRDGNRYVYADGYMYGESDDYFCDCYDLKDKYNNDLTSKGSYETVYDIVKVERKGEVIFERVEETKREMTIEEIEKELGYSIKIVKEVA